MSIDERNTAPSLKERARDLGVNVLVFTGAQILAALLAWQLIFRTHPQGLAMGLSLVGFASWGLAFLLSFRMPFRPRMGRTMFRPGVEPLRGSPPRDGTSSSGKLPVQLGSAGCGTVLFLSGLISLGIAFVLRVRADMQSGLTWNEIFPTQP